MPNKILCRFCEAPLDVMFADLGEMPLANNYILQEDVPQEKFEPLRVRVCASCFLVQADDPVDASHIFDAEYAYFSSYSDSWVEHARLYAEKMTEQLKLDSSSLVIEVASNDGYLLQHFVRGGVPVLGIEPAANCAAVARENGVPTDVGFFNAETARRYAEQGVKADLMIGNNVLAHVPKIGEFVAGFPILMNPEATLTFEFPHLLNLVEQVQFDTIYHEHFSYLSLIAVENVAKSVGLRVYEVEELPTHGGSLRVFCCHEGASFTEGSGVARVREKEANAGLHSIEFYENFMTRVYAIRTEFLAFLERVRKEGATLAAYGAAAKGNTFLNFCNVGAASIKCVYDRNPMKQDRLLPGSHIPVVSPDLISELKPDYVLILPWNLRTEVADNLASIREWGGRFVTAIPRMSIF